MSRETLDKILITGIIPYFLEKRNFWFEKNLESISRAAKTQTFWQANTLFLEKDQKINLSEILKKLDEMGYEKVFEIESPGEFSQRGGIVSVFPINSNFALRIDFLGNIIDAIEKLGLEIEDEEKQKEILKNKLKSQRIFSGLKGLNKGDFVVHLDHGIGKFIGIKKLQDLKSRTCEYYVFEYAANDKLYVPLGLERKLSLYIGFKEPRLSRLGSYLWQKTKRKAKEETEKFAKELLEIFAQKEMSQRPPYWQDEIYQSLNQNFQYVLTPDQEESLKEIEKDLLAEKPMDRILCGDVGFGKTEVALRMTVRAAENERQAALICPTTILASQHFETFKKRLKDLPFKIGMLSRIQLKKEQKIILQELAEGKIDILIGTHRILGKDVIFKDLGLLIIDDEHKFGVLQKEKLRKLKPGLDVLYLSATPIPRTLYLGLSSLKNVSLIQTPPQGRKSIKTFILPFKKEAIKKAIEKELERKGQIYFLHNRIETILGFKKFLEELETKSQIRILHGRMEESEMIETMENFQQEKFNLLLATTIIENGLDLPKVNTLIVDNATKLGLAQAYQLRGRIGRSHIQSFAYFLYPKGKLSGLAKKRLKALKEAEELGSGYKIAQRDLELRGAGNILGKEQSGSVNKIGLNLYCQMLSLAIEKLKTQS